MKKLLVLVLLVMFTVLFSSQVEAQEVKLFEIDGYNIYHLEKNRCPVYVYYDIVGYKDKEEKQPIYEYVSSCNVYEVGSTVQVVKQKHFREYYVFIKNGVIDNSWHDYREE